MWSARFRHQNRVLVIAAAGDWWSCTLYTRHVAFVRGLVDLENYFFRLDKEDWLDNDNDNLDVVLTADQMKSKPRRVDQTSWAAERQKQKEAVADRRARDAEARAKRYADQAARKQATEDFNAIAADAKYPFGNDILQIGCVQIIKDEDFRMIPDDDYLNKTVDLSSITSNDLKVVWSPVMRLGDAASDRYLQMIRAKMANI
ncbi:hypothetical protein CYLTODRAFT_456945 [Cylindrobasidium torrendii FP15055 ss-10]|uniref:Uncharacterized protein n=1 Tax=Cylindrobasidium torrendii FP15055 ss-10 TaxID=1314674 RepID=A0A0D7B5F0_9AGAR|nr:hypothetical protein CYLTODRAFT_456945 [Cylindrobasidium torrendii FP15055 ss-10]